MTDAPSEYDEDKPSQAEGEDPDRPDTAIVLESEGKPSQPEGEDPDDASAAHVVLDPVEPD
jgi:hypothetical protein